MQDLVLHLVKRDRRRRRSRQPQDESGQSLVEIAVGAPFLILLVLAFIEMGIVFAVYISLINAAREGAMFASKYPQLSDWASHADDEYTCPDASCPTLGEEYENRIANEVFVEPGQTLVGRQLIAEDPHPLEAAHPVVVGSLEKGNPITVTVTYSVETFTSRMVLPFFGRFGLPNKYVLHYSIAMPIR